MLLAAVAGASPFPAAGEYRYSASMAGQNIGGWSISVRDRDGGMQIDETSSASFAGMQMSATASLALGADLAPVSYIGNYRMAGQNPSVSVTLTSSAATVAGAMTTAPQRVALAANTRHFVVVEPGLLAGIFALPAQLAAWKESSVTWITPATAQNQALTVNSALPAQRPPAVPAQDAVLSVQRPIVVTIWYDPATFVPDQIVVPSQNAVLTRVRS
ncbi:MAG: hypothetical protein WB609_08165 [Candidatus Cybelea sp.]